jgi:hypothetical protein
LEGSHRGNKIQVSYDCMNIYTKWKTLLVLPIQTIKPIYMYQRKYYVFKTPEFYALIVMYLKIHPRFTSVYWCSVTSWKWSKYIETCRSYDKLCVKIFNFKISAFSGFLCELFMNARTWMTVRSLCYFFYIYPIKCKNRDNHGGRNYDLVCWDVITFIFTYSLFIYRRCQ